MSQLTSFNFDIFSPDLAATVSPNEKFAAKCEFRLDYHSVSLLVEHLAHAVWNAKKNDWWYEHVIFTTIANGLWRNGIQYKDMHCEKTVFALAMATKFRKTLAELQHKAEQQAEFASKVPF